MWLRVNSCKVIGRQLSFILPLRINNAALRHDMTFNGLILKPSIMILLHNPRLSGFVTKATLEESQRWPESSFFKWMDSQTLTGVGEGRTMTFASGETQGPMEIISNSSVFCLHQCGADGWCWWIFLCLLVHWFILFSTVLCRVELQKMTIVRPPTDVARYTMVFHKRDSGNEINKDRSVNVEMGIVRYVCFSILQAK